MTEWLKNPYYLSGLDGRRLELILFPTEKCNFRCTYCYEDFKIGQMKPEVIEGISNLISRRASSLDTLAISWFGGEPLMARDVIMQIMRHARDQASRAGAFVASSMTTNGWYLDIKTLGELTDVGVRHYQISLDGYGFDHDQTRLHIGGGSTFEKIWSNLLSAHASALDFDFLLRVHTHPRNEAGLLTLVEAINARFAGDPRFHVMFQPVEDLGQGGDMAVFDTPAAKQVADRMTILLKAGLRHVDVFADEYVCYASRPNSFCIRADGRVAKCTVALNDDRNTVGQIDTSGRLNLNNAAHEKWFSGLASGDKEALACPYSLIKYEDVDKMAIA